MSKIITTDAIVLKTKDQRDTSRSLIAFTKDMGKLYLIAKGSRKPKSRFGACLEPFVHNQIVFYHKENRDSFYLSHCDIINAFINLHRDLDRMNYAASAAILADNITPYNEQNVALFNLLFSIFTELNRSDAADLQTLYWAYQIKLMSLAGFQPMLNECTACGKASLSSDAQFFAPNAGGLLCRTCAGKNPRAQQIHPSIITMFVHFLTEKFSQNKKWRVKDDVAAQVNSMLHNFIEYHLEKKISIPPIL